MRCEGNSKLTTQKASKNLARPSKNLSLLSFSDLKMLIEHSAILEGKKAEAFFEALQKVALYYSELALQQAHSNALLTRMKRSRDFEEVRDLNHLQESVPHFSRSIVLQELYAQGLVLVARKNPDVEVHRDSLTRLFRLSGFGGSLVIQECAGELYLESIINCRSLGEGQELARQLSRLPGLERSPKLQALVEQGQKLARQSGRQPVVKIDLNQTLMAPVRAVGRMLGMADYRMRVALDGSPRYKQVVVRVPAFSEKGARKRVENFLDDFLRDDSDGFECRSEILDIFPPGSLWESGRHPVLKL